MMRRALFCRASWVALGLLGGACSSNDAPPKSGSTCSAFSSQADVTSPVSFVADVQPILEKNCTTGGARCHGDLVTLPYLGVPDAAVDPTRVLAGIVGVDSAEDPTMAFIAPGDPIHSYLMHKIDGDVCTLASQCASNKQFSDCGETMPFLAPMLPVATRDTIRAWIAQGAQNN
jgi:hypothetical protein